jgi:hypothetical protein
VILANGFGLLARPAAAAAASPPVPAASASMVAHRALYTVSMTSARPGGAYVDVNGKMFYEFADCGDAWTSNQKFLLHYFSADGPEVRFDSDYSSWESKAGDSYTFSVRRARDGEVVEEYRGQAKRRGAAAGGLAEFTKPERKALKLPPHFLFPTAQTMKLIEHADRGDKFFNAELFDGTDGGGALQVNAVVLGASKKPDDLSLKSPLLDPPAHRVRIAFYPAEGAPADADPEGEAAAQTTTDQPDYEMTMTLHDNGVVSDMTIDYEEFSIHGRLQSIESRPRPHC